MSTSKLQRKVSELLSAHLGQYTIRENSRPDWLITEQGQRLELDFYIEELSLAIEIQGQQHFAYTEIFHGDYDGFLAQQERDKKKAKMCWARGIELVEIYDEQTAHEFFQKLRKNESPKEDPPTQYIGERLSRGMMRRLETLQGFIKGYHKHGKIKPLAVLESTLENIEKSQYAPNLNPGERELIKTAQRIVFAARTVQ